MKDVNYFYPLQQENGRWDMCCVSPARGISSVGYCAGYRRLPDIMSILYFNDSEFETERDKFAAMRDRYHLDGHATAEEAVACYRRYLLDHTIRRDQYPVRFTQPCRADGCFEHTHHYVVVGKDWNAVLCPTHDDSVVATLFADLRLEGPLGW